ncbi:MAG TPA: hypothetical protein DCW29_07450 [Janthinobacterium sp.]|nr:hypothetical protein [Janthinobacterium sp.]
MKTLRKGWKKTVALWRGLKSGGLRERNEPGQAPAPKSAAAQVDVERRAPDSPMRGGADRRGGRNWRSRRG